MAVKENYVWHFIIQANANEWNTMNYKIVTVYEKTEWTVKTVETWKGSLRVVSRLNWLTY